MKNRKGKINILDLLVILVVIAIFLAAGYKVSHKSKSYINLASDKKPVEFSVLITASKGGFFDVIKVGDVLSDLKTPLDIKVTDVKVLPLMVKGVDLNGNIVTSEDPTKELCLVSCKGNMTVKNGIYRLGTNECRAGKYVFLESKYFKYRGQVQTMKVLE